MIKLNYIIICILGWIFGIYANELIDREIKGEKKPFPRSQILKKTWSSWILGPIKNVLKRGHTLLKGKTQEKKKILFPIAREILTILIILLTYTNYSGEAKGLAAFFFIYILIIIWVIDYHLMIIPNKLNLTLAVFALLCVLFNVSVSWQEAALGALVGGGILLLSRWLPLLIIKKPGMGIGDIKLAFVCGLYLGPSKVLLGLIISIYIAGISLLILLLFKKIKKNQYIPYGPFLSTGFIISLIFHGDIMRLLHSLL